MALQFGRGAFISVAVESSYGTVAPSGYTDMRLISSTLQKTVERSRKTHLNQGNAGFVIGTFEGFNVTGGNITGPLCYAGNGDLFYAALGKVPVDAGAGPYTHTFDVAATQPSLTVRLNRGAALSGSADMDEFKGCIISNFTISCAAGEEAIFSAEIIAQDASTRTSASAASFPATALQVFHHQFNNSSKLSFNGNTFNVRSFELSIDNKIERRNYLGTQLTEQPTISDVREVRLTCTMDLEDNNLYTDFITTPTFVDSDATLQFVGTGNDQLDITVYNAVIEEYSDNVTTFGRIERTVTFLGTVNGANEACRVVITNDEASHE